MDIKRLLEKIKNSSFDERLFFLAGICDEIPSILKKYFTGSGNTSYIDTVVGSAHDVDTDLPDRALNLLKKQKLNKTLIKKTLKEYLEPITALRDSDFEIADQNTRLGYYAIYNLLRYAAGESTEEQFDLITNQAVSCLFGKLVNSEKFNKKVADFFESKLK